MILSLEVRGCSIGVDRAREQLGVRSADELAEARKLVKRTVAVAVLALALLYVGDGLSVPLRAKWGGNPYGSVTVTRSYSVTKKDGKPDFYFNPPEAQTCVRTIFPHFGDPPCWYLSQHTQQEVDL